jgi:energy-converting hydrogenase B subunit D
MTALIAMLLLLVAATGLGVVVSHDPRRQVFALAGNGLAFSLLFFALQAPDVALSEIVVGTAATPLLFLAALVAIRIERNRAK